MSHDPTREEMLAFLADNIDGKLDELFDEFDREEAMYWFANDWHSGQWSNLYKALCASPYSPGACANGPQGETGAFLYDQLVKEFGE